MSYLLYIKLLKATGWDFSHDDLLFLGFPWDILEPLDNKYEITCQNSYD